MTPLPDTDLEQLARRRAGLKLGWFIHAGVYLAVNLLLAAVAFATGRHWAIFPLFGWGIGLAVHGLVVFLRTHPAMFDALVERERRHLRGADPW